ncbi:hypothetical protein OG730_41700 (plasmid) [Streptomyces sp. NBC_01298]|uniref:hypothetical protein n=1 Tax=Streptomyces sp. NBC_01298 TaxID=2903817 RepID=UPI002E0D2E3D|nr:hypothetical protein OG730_41700 [Streptomyces sp. NBC_01298]
MNTITPYQAHISHDAQLSLDAEPQVVPDGIDPSQVLLQILHIQAAGSGTPVQVHVSDDRTGSGFDIEVLPDGTTRPPGTQATTAADEAPTSPTSNDLARRLATAHEAGRAHDFETAIPAADALIQDLAAEFGETAPRTLKAAQFRADLAVLEGDYAYATASWTWLALTWYDGLGPGMRLTQVAAGNAAWTWMQLEPDEAVISAPDLLSMLNEVTTPDRTQTIRAQIEERLLQATN